MAFVINMTKNSLKICIYETGSIYFRYGWKHKFWNFGQIFFSYDFILFQAAVKTICFKTTSITHEIYKMSSFYYTVLKVLH